MKVVIPARFGSSRLPGKPLKLIAGRPMIQHVYELALKAGAEQVIIATDDQRIADFSHEIGATCCMTSVNHESGTDRIAEVIESFGWDDDEIIVNLQGDEPLMPASLVKQVADDLADFPDAVTSTLSAAIESNEQIFDPNTVKVVTDKSGYALYFSRASIPWQRGSMEWGGDIDESVNQNFQRHIGLYAYRAGFVRDYITWSAAPIELQESLEQLRILWNGKRIHVSTAAELPPAGVDTEEDLQRVDALFREMSG